jgi:hypothetical protein
MDSLTKPPPATSSLTRIRWQPWAYWPGLLAVLTVLTVASWALRPASRRVHHAMKPS